MRWHILGAGSIGGLWAARLAHSGEKVSLLLRDPDSVAELVKSPLKLESADQTILPGVEAVAVAELSREIDWLLVTTKSFSTLEAIASVERCLTSASTILLLQNGIGVQQQVAARYPGQAVIAGVTTDGAYRRGRHHVVHAGHGQTRFGAVTPVPSARIALLRQCLSRIALEAYWVEDIWPPLWRKLAINCCINAPSALAQCRNGELLENDDSRRQIEGLVAEIQQVMQASGLGFSLPRLYQEVLEVIAATADNYSSMCEDVRHGRRTEIEYINGFICAEGARHGIETPLNRALVDAVASS